MNIPKQESGAINFEHWLRAGLGRAVLYLQQHDPIPHREAILNACLHNVALDRQLEGTRVEYLMDVLEATREVEFYQRHVLNTLEMLTETADEDDVGLVIDLARTFAQHGDTQARAATYQKFEALPGLGGFVGANAIIDLDGLDGYLRVAERFRAHLMTLGDEFIVGENSYFLDDELARALKTRIWKAQAKRWYAKEPHVICYMGAVIAESPAPMSVSGPQPADLTVVHYDEIKALIDHPNPRQHERWHLWTWGKQSSDGDILRAATDLLAETDPKRLLLYVDIFRHRTFPFDPTKLIGLAQNGHNPLRLHGEGALIADRLAFGAIHALEEVTHPVVRAYALESIGNGYLVALMVGLLIHNFVEGDWAFIEELTRREFDDNEYHTLAFKVRHIFDEHPSQAAIGPLLNLYEKGLCSQCRYKAVEQLHRIAAIPAWMREECLYDDNLDLREAAKSDFKNSDTDKSN